MDAKDRRATVADAFQVLYPAVVAGERILLVDDVFTTGATVSSCAKDSDSGWGKQRLRFNHRSTSEKLATAICILSSRLRAR